MDPLHLNPLINYTRKKGESRRSVLGSEGYNQIQLHREPIAKFEVFSCNCSVMKRPGSNLNFANVCDAVEGVSVTGLDNPCSPNNHTRDQTCFLVS
jgi:hypothetical protein